MDYQLIKPLFPQVSLSAVERVLTNRGIHCSDIEHYLHTTDDDIISPEAIMNIDTGAKMLIRHLGRGDKVLIQIDSDADGFTSSALLLNYLNCHFPGLVQNNISYRVHTGKQHGIPEEIIPEIISNEFKLVIAPDASSNDYKQHQELKEHGVDVLVIDHHEAEKISEYACIINNQLCDYPTKSLSGVGMVFKFCSYLDELLETDYASSYLDLVALGMVADMMDLRDFETKHLINKGLKNINNPYLKGMTKTQSFSIERHGGLDPFAVAFYIAPYVNATIRIGSQDEKLMLFESMLDYRGYEQVPSTKRGCKGQTETRVEQACRNCSNIKNRQTKARDASLDIIERKIEEENLLQHKLLVIKLDESIEFDKNITGLIANQLMAQYQRPTLLLSKVNDNGIISWQGSGRNVGNSKLENLRAFLSDTGFAMYAEGHASAFGFGILDSNFDDFISYTDDALKDFDFTPCYRVDMIYSSMDFNPNDIIDIAELKSLWGQGVEEPLIAIENIQVSANKLALMSPDKNPTLKITLPNGTSLIKFKASKEEFDSLNSDLGCVTINIVGKCERNIWNGKINPQIIVEDYEIVGKTEYYF